MLVALGRLTVPSVNAPVSVLSRLSTTQLNKIAATVQLAPAHGVQIQTYFSNTGKIWIGDQDMNQSTGAGVGHLLAPPSTNFYPSWSAALTLSPNATSLAGIYLGADVPGETVLLFVLVH